MSAPKVWTRDELIDVFLAVAVRLGRRPAQSDFYRGAVDVPCHTTFTREFGSFRAAQFAAGFLPRVPSKWPPKEVCKHGHAMVGANIYERVTFVHGKAYATRACKQCRYLRRRKQLDAQKALTAARRPARAPRTVRRGHSRAELEAYWGIRQSA